MRTITVLLCVLFLASSSHAEEPVFRGTYEVVQALNKDAGDYYLERVDRSSSLEIWVAGGQRLDEGAIVDVYGGMFLEYHDPGQPELLRYPQLLSNSVAQPVRPFCVSEASIIQGAKLAGLSLCGYKVRVCGKVNVVLDTPNFRLAFLDGGSGIVQPGETHKGLPLRITTDLSDNYDLIKSMPVGKMIVVEGVVLYWVDGLQQKAGIIPHRFEVIE